MNCNRCSGLMEYIGKKYIQLGKATIFMPNMSHIFEGALETEIFVCSKCGKVELFIPGKLSHDEYVTNECIASDEDETFEQAFCPYCGKEHAYYLESCPHCKKKLYNNV